MSEETTPRKLRGGSKKGARCTQAATEYDCDTRPTQRYYLMNKHECDDYSKTNTYSTTDGATNGSGNGSAPDKSTLCMVESASLSSLIKKKQAAGRTTRKNIIGGECSTGRQHHNADDNFAQAPQSSSERKRKAAPTEGRKTSLKVSEKRHKYTSTFEEKKWFGMLQMHIDYKKKYGTFKIKHSENHALYQWASRQQILFTCFKHNIEAPPRLKLGAISKERADILEREGLVDTTLKTLNGCNSHTTKSDHASSATIGAVEAEISDVDDDPFLLRRVAKYFLNANGTKELFFGTIVSVERGDGRFMYSIAYDDGDEEDVWKSDINRLLNLHAKNKNDDVMMNHSSSVDDEKMATFIDTVDRSAYRCSEKSSSDSFTSVQDSQDEVEHINVAEGNEMLIEKLEGKPSDPILGRSDENIATGSCQKVSVVDNQCVAEIVYICRPF